MAKITAEQLKQCLRSHPEQFDMATWVQQTDCGTAYCIGGWALVMAGYQTWINHTGRPVFDVVYDKDIGSVACELLGLKENNAVFSHDLFMELDWPEGIRPPDVYESETPEQRVERACRAIDYYLPAA